jgi:hypothetical protein
LVEFPRMRSRSARSSLNAVVLTRRALEWPCYGVTIR